MKSKYKVTMKFWDENDRVCYLRLPANCPFFLLTGNHTSVNEQLVDSMYKTIAQTELPAEALPVFTLPTQTSK